MSDNKIVIDISDVEKAKTSLKELSAQLGVSGNMATEAEGKLKSMANTLKAANAAPLASGFLLLTAALGSAAVAAKGFMDSFVESAAGLNNLSTKTGIAVEQLSIMSSVAKMSGTSMDTVTGAVMKFEKSIAAGSKETSLQAKAFKELGISTSDTSVTTEQYLSMAAEKLNGLHDGWQKNNISMALFGKNGADLNEFLGDYAERGDMAAKVTAEQAAQAEEYERSMKKLGATTNAYKALIGSALLPVAKALTDEFLAMAGSVNKMDDSSKEAMKNQIADWAFGIAKGLGAAIDVGLAFWNVISGTAQAIGVLIGSLVTMGEVFSKVMSGDFKGAWDLAKTNASQLKDGLSDAWNTASKDSSKYYDLVTRAEDNFQKNKGKKLPTDTRPNPRNIGSDEGGGNASAASESGFTAAYKKEEDAIIKLRGEYLKLYGIRQDTHQQLLQAAIDAGEFNEKTDKSGKVSKEAATAEQLSALKASAIAADYLEGLIERTKQEKALWDQVQKTSDAEAAKVQNMRKSINESNIQRDVMKTYGATQNDVNIAVNDYNISQAQSALTIAELTNASEQEVETLRIKLQTLREIGILQKDKKEDDDAEAARLRTFSYGWESAFNKYKDDAGNAASHAQTMFATASKGMEDAFVNFAKTGKLSFADMTQSILANLVQIAAQKAAAGMMSMAMSFAFSANGNAFGSSGILKSANGNVFDSPTMHGYSGGIGMLGEAGPEAVMPLKRNASGQLGVVAQGGGSSGSSIQNNFSITVNGASDPQDTANKVAAQIKMMQQLADGRIANATRIGGISNPVTATAF